MSTPTFPPVELPSRYSKAIVAILTAALTVLVTALADNTVDMSEIVGIAVAVVTAVGVYLVPNLSGAAGSHAKLIVAIVGTALQAAVPLLTDGQFTTTSWLLVLLAALGAVGVNIIPNSEVVGQVTGPINIVYPNQGQMSTNPYVEGDTDAADNG